MIDDVFCWCVDVLDAGAAMLGISYQAINVWIFCVIWPLVTIALIVTVLVQAVKLRNVKQSLK